jgi:hypothetical protein
MKKPITNELPTGGNVNYYLVDVASPKRLEPYTAEAEDIIETLCMSFAEGNVFKALWRSCAVNSTRVVKPGLDIHGVYDAEKMVYYSQRVLTQRKALKIRHELETKTSEEIVPIPTITPALAQSYTLQQFGESIAAMNVMYKLPCNTSPTVFPGEPIYDRMPKFMKTMHDEIEEGDEIYSQALGGQVEGVNLLTSVADILGDIVVYAFSEAVKYGIPLLEVLQIIMESNASKLDADGNPIYNAEGKFLKGPNYWKPEPRICELLAKHVSKATGI